MDKEEVMFLRKVIKAQDKLLTCCRFGRNPPEWALNILAKFRSMYDNSQTASEPSDAADEKRECEDCGKGTDDCICHIPQDLEPHFSRF